MIAVILQEFICLVYVFNELEICVQFTLDVLCSSLVCEIIIRDGSEAYHQTAGHFITFLGVGYTYPVHMPWKPCGYH